MGVVNCNQWARITSSNSLAAFTSQSVDGKGPAAMSPLAVSSFVESLRGFKVELHLQSFVVTVSSELGPEKYCVPLVSHHC